MKYKKEILYKLVCFVNRNELDSLDSIVKDIYFSTGRKLARTQLLREIIRTFDSIYNFNQQHERTIKTEGGCDA